MSVGQPDRVAPERIELRQVPAGLARVLADPEADVPDSRSWAQGYPLPGTRVAARNLVRQAEATGDGGNGQWGMFQIILRETGEVIGDIGFHGPPDEAWSRPEVTRIIARTEKGNAASAGVLRHAGFREDGVANGLQSFSLDRL
jgi:RimJ/RimL family protein N-acetyltransferase